MLKNIEEIRNIAKKPPEMSSAQDIKTMEKVKYLFYGLTKTMVDIGNNIIEENEFRKPLNNADVFISLAEHDILISDIVPGIKKAVFAIPKITGCSYDELLSVISKSINDIHKCLDSFAVYFKRKQGSIQS